MYNPSCDLRILTSLLLRPEGVNSKQEYSKKYMIMLHDTVLY